MNREALSGEACAKLAQTYLLLKWGGGEEVAPQLRRLPLRPRRHSVVRKDGPWVIALSGQCATKWEDNRFILDRQCLLSAWHESAGPVLDGSNSKQQPELATFHRGEDHLPLSARLLPAEGRSERSKSSTRPSKAPSARHPTDAHTLELTLSTTEDATFTLLPAVSFGETVTLGIGNPNPGRRRPSTATSAASRLRFRSARLTLPAGARAVYPISPFNSYHPRGLSPNEANKLILTGPVGPAGVVGADRNSRSAGFGVGVPSAND